MKNLIGILFVCGVLFTSCERKFDLGEFNYDDMEAPEIAPISPDAVARGKKGACFTLNGNNFPKLSSLKIHWFYTWGAGRDGTVYDIKPEYTEFVPMQWGKWWLDANIAAYKVFKDAGKMHYLLGFNEPDGVEQANMTVDQAIDRWPQLEEVGVPLGSPATVDPTNDWMKEFMQRATQNNLRVDFVAVHSYRGASATSFINMLKETYNLYGKPIWITEFAVADWQAETPEDNKYSPEKVLNFMKELLPQLEALDFVHRYSWFSFKQSNAHGTSSALFDLDGNMTPLGEYYANFMPNNDIGPAKN